MSLSGAISNALSGLTVSSRSAAVVSSNIANAMNDGYARRDVSISSRSVGTYGGARLDGITRDVDATLLRDVRSASSGLSEAETGAAYHTRLQSLLGTPEDERSLPGRLAALENAFVTAASRPDLPERLGQVLSAAQDVTATFGTVTDGIQQIRMDADADIAASVARVNDLLSQIKDLNTAITALGSSKGSDSAALMDHRQAAIDELSQYIPVTEAARPNDRVALYTPGGAILLDGNAAELGFTRTNVIVPHMTQDNALLSGLQINGMDVKTGEGSGISGGKLGMLFAIRDAHTVAAQTELDAAARDLVERFQDPALDATRGPGDPGFLTDAGLAFVATDEIGLSGRLAVNAAVDPEAGGATWRIRDGLGAAVPGPVGDATLLNDMHGALEAQRVPASGSFGSGGLTAATLSSHLLSHFATEANLSDQRVGYATSFHSELKDRLLQDGVDTDQEMQKLLMIEQSYAANARLIQTVESIMDALLRI